MNDHRPVPNDALGSLFDFASWLYPRIWGRFALIFSFTLLPGLVLSVLAAVLAGFITAGSVGEAVSAREFGRLGVLAAAKAAYWAAVLYFHWTCVTVADAVSRGESPDGAAGVSLSRFPAQLWTMLSYSLRLMPVGLLMGILSALIFPRSRAAGALVIVLGAALCAYYLFSWLLSGMVTQLEGLSGGAALSRSSRLCRPRFWLVTGQALCFHAAAMVPTTLIAVYSIRVLPYWAATVPGVVLGTLVVTPFTTGMLLALYRRETARAAAAEPEPV